MRRWLLKWNTAKLQALSDERRQGILAYEIAHLDLLVQKGDLDTGERLQLISELYDMAQGKESPFPCDGFVCFEKIPERRFTESPEYPGWKIAIDWVVNRPCK
jgi:hypothetical protein